MRSRRAHNAQVCESLVMQLKQQVIIQRRLQQRVTDRDWVVEPEDLEGPPAAYVRKETLENDDEIDTSATDSDDDDEDNDDDGSSVNVPPP